VAGLIQSPLDVPPPGQREMSPPINPSLTSLSPDRMRAVMGIPPPAQAAEQPSAADVDVESLSPADLLSLAGRIFFSAKDKPGLIEAIQSLLKAIRKYADDQMAVRSASLLRLPVPLSALPPSAGEVGMSPGAPASPETQMPPMAPPVIAPQQPVTDPRLALLQRMRMA